MEKKKKILFCRVCLMALGDLLFSEEKQRKNGWMGETGCGGTGRRGWRLNCGKEC